MIRRLIRRSHTTEKAMTYVPSSMPQPGDEMILEVIRRSPLMSVISVSGSNVLSSHVPAEVHRTGPSLESVSINFHLAKSNPHWQALHASPRVLLIFRGPDSYVSPRWYDHQNVPTWDYAIVQIHGDAVPFNDEAATAEHLYALIQQMEPGLEVDRDFAMQYVTDVRAFAVTNLRVEPLFKLSQDKSDASIEGVITGLRHRASGLDLETADFVKRVSDEVTH